MAEEGKLDPVVGREKEIERLPNFKPQKTTITIGRWW
jgi:hypothetical protein